MLLRGVSGFIILGDLITRSSRRRPLTVDRSVFTARGRINIPAIRAKELDRIYSRHIRATAG
jgi:hypothetical protein